MDLSRFIIGNWKMNGLLESLSVLEEIKEKVPFLLSSHDSQLHCSQLKTILCLPTTLIAKASIVVANTALEIGAQDCSPVDFGAYTGDVSAPMLYDAGARYVLVGHSERKTYHQETNQQIFSKIESAWRAKLIPILCVGEILADKEAHKTFSVLEQQIAACLPNEANEDNIIVAYEPVWAINSSITPNVLEISKIHDYLRSCLKKKNGKKTEMIPILYGGAVNESNVQSLLESPNIRGLLVGRASLCADSFVSILHTAYKNL